MDEMNAEDGQKAPFESLEFILFLNVIWCIFYINTDISNMKLINSKVLGHKSKSSHKRLFVLSVLSSAACHTVCLEHGI